MDSVDAARRAPENTPVDCTVVVVTFNNRSDIVGFLDALRASADGIELRIVVVDNRSCDGTLDAVEGRPGALAIDAGSNTGYAGGVNIGRIHADGDTPILVANPDLRFEPGAVAELLAVIADDPLVGIVVPKLVGPDGFLRYSLRREPTIGRAIGEALFGDHFGSRPAWMSEIVRDHRAYERQHNVDWATGAAMMVSPRCNQIVGEWDDSFFLYSEEVDYAARTRAAGMAVRYAPRAVAMHAEGGSGRSPALSALMAVNRVRYFELSHGSVSTAAFRLIVVFHEMLRGRDPARRRAAMIVARRRQWKRLPSASEPQP